MGLLERLRTTFGLARSTDVEFTLSEYLAWLQYQGLSYPISPSNTLGEDQEEPAATFAGYIEGAYKANGIVFACMLVRMSLFAEARFLFRQRRNGRPGDLFFNSDLEVLERPEPGKVTGDLLSRAIQDADLAGNNYHYRTGNRIRRMRPDWVTIVLGSQQEPDEAGFALDAEVIGYLYKPGGSRGSAPAKSLLPEQVAHFAPIPDPIARFRGMSWLTPVIREVMGDQAATQHKLRFFEKGATPNIAVTTDPSVTGQAFKDFVEIFREEHPELTDAYRTIFLGGGANIEVVGSTMEQTDFKAVQGAGETRIAAAAGVPPVVVGLSEGLEAATYSNYGQAMRRLADITMRPLWRNMCGSMSNLITVPGDAELWFADDDIAALQSDVKDAATVLETQSRAVRNLTDGGYEPGSVVDAVTSGDLKRLKHSGLMSVQLLPPGSSQNGPEPEPEPIGAADE